MLCDTCVYKDCDGISCSECKFLRRSETLHGQIMDVCYCDIGYHGKGKRYRSDKLIKCDKYLSKQMTFKKEDKDD